LAERFVIGRQYLKNGCPTGMTSAKQAHGLLLATVLMLLAISAIRPHDYFTWLLEVAPVLFGVPLLIFTYGRFRLTTLLYILLSFHALILIVGGHYTYAEVPLFNWLRDTFGLSRNHYDRVGHFAQGFVPAILAREILIRRTALKPGKWLTFLSAAICLAFSAFYELVEWWTALATGEAATAFLGTQGDQWDTQWDMFLALIGACISLILLSRVHDRALRSLRR
jgi:putative membrane protein